MGQAMVFEPEVLAAVLPDGRVVFSDSSAYALKVTGDGDPWGCAHHHAAARSRARDARDRESRNGPPGLRARCSRRPSRRAENAAAPGSRRNTGNGLDRHARARLLSRTLDSPRPRHHMGRPHLGSTPAARIRKRTVPSMCSPPMATTSAPSPQARRAYPPPLAPRVSSHSSNSTSWMSRRWSCGDFRQHFADAMSGRAHAGCRTRKRRFS